MGSKVEVPSNGTPEVGSTGGVKRPRPDSCGPFKGGLRDLKGYLKGLAA